LLCSAINGKSSPQVLFPSMRFLFPHASPSCTAPLNIFFPPPSFTLCCCLSCFLTLTTSVFLSRCSLRLSENPVRGTTHRCIIAMFFFSTFSFPQHSSLIGEPPGFKCPYSEFFSLKVFPMFRSCIRNLLLHESCLVFGVGHPSRTRP